MVFGLMMMVFYVKNNDDFVETYLRTNFFMMSNLGLIGPTSFYVRNPELVKYVRRDFLRCPLVLMS